jgi:moderate conductance mechanosensitive channel
VPTDLSSLTKGTPDCVKQSDSLCHHVWSVTHTGWLAAGADWFVARPLQILLIIVVAFVTRWFVHRAIRRLVYTTTEGAVPTVLRPLRERTSPRLLDSAGLLSERRRQRAQTIGSVLRSFATFCVYSIAAILILGELGLDITPIIASAGIAGVALGFGAQNLVKDFLSGIFMILEDQYGVGDVVDAGQASGTVEAVGLRTTRLRDVRGVVWHVRNGEIQRVGNMSQGWARAVLDIPLSYDNDLAFVRQVIKTTADEVWQDPDFSTKVLEEPQVTGIEQLNPDAVVMRLMVKTAPMEQWAVARELRARLVRAFERGGIRVPVSTNAVIVTTEPLDLSGETEVRPRNGGNGRNGDEEDFPEPEARD